MPSLLFANEKMKLKVYSDGVVVKRNKLQSRSQAQPVEEPADRSSRRYMFEPFNVQSIYNPKLLPKRLRYLYQIKDRNNLRNS